MRESPTGRAIADLISWQILFVVAAVAAYWVYQNYGHELGFVGKIIVIALAAASFPAFVLRSVLPPNILDISIVGAAVLGAVVAYSFADTPGKTRKRESNDKEVAEARRSEADAEQRNPAQIPIRQALDAFFAKPFSPLFPNATKGNLCAAYPSFDCEEIEPLKRPRIFMNDGSQEAGLYLIEEGKAHVTLSYRKEIKGSFSETVWIVARDPRYEFSTGNFPSALRKIAVNQLQRLGIDDASIKKCLSADGIQRMTATDGKPFACEQGGGLGKEYRSFVRFVATRDGPPLVAGNPR